MRQLAAPCAIAAFSVVATAATADEANAWDQPEGSRHGPLYLLGEIFENVYGPNIHSDGTGRAFEWRTRDGKGTNTRVKRDAYGLGVGMDAYGRPVVAVPKD